MKVASPELDVISHFKYNGFMLPTPAFSGTSFLMCCSLINRNLQAVPSYFWKLFWLHILIANPQVTISNCESPHYINYTLQECGKHWKSTAVNCRLTFESLISQLLLLPHRSLDVWWPLTSLAIKRGYDWVEFSDSLDMKAPCVVLKVYECWYLTTSRVFCVFFLLHSDIQASRDNSTEQWSWKRLLEFPPPHLLLDWYIPCTQSTSSLCDSIFCLHYLSSRHHLYLQRGGSTFFVPVVPLSVARKQQLQVKTCHTRLNWAVQITQQTSLSLVAFSPLLRHCNVSSLNHSICRLVKLLPQKSRIFLGKEM